MSARPPRRRQGRIGVAISTVALVLLATACGGTAGTSGGTSAAASLDPARDKLARILQRGTLLAYSTPDYRPQSIHVDGAVRPADTKCLTNQLTAPEVTGFDIDSTKVIAKGLGVEVCFFEPSWTETTAGNWGDRMDIAYASGAITGERMAALWMTQPYYYIPQRYAVRTDSTFKVPADLEGKKIGICTGCTVESYLKGGLEIPGVELKPPVKASTLVGYEYEVPGLQALADGTIDAYLTAEPVAAQAIKDGLPLRMIDEPAFAMYISGYVDKGQTRSVAAFTKRVNEIMAAAHADGTMKALSMQWFGTDYTTPAGAFDLSALKQQIP